MESGPFGLASVPTVLPMDMPLKRSLGKAWHVPWEQWLVVICLIFVKFSFCVKHRDMKVNSTDELAAILVGQLLPSSHLLLRLTEG